MRYNVIIELVKHQIIAAKPLEQFVSSAKKNKNKLLNSILRILGLILISSSFIYLLGVNYFGYLQISSFLNILSKGIAYCIFSSTIILFFVSTTYLEHVYFRGKDIRLWSLLPISKSEFFLSRFLVSYVYSLMINIVVTMPLIVAIFYYMGFSLLILVSSILLFLLLPIVALLLSSLLVTLKIILFKGKSIKVVDFLFNNAPFLVAILYVSKTSNEMLQLMINGDINSQITAYTNYITQIGSLPYFSTMGKMFLSSNSLLLFIVIAALIFVGSVFIISPLFDKCLNLVKNASNSENSKKKKINNAKQADLNSSSLFLSLIKREYYILSSEKGFMGEIIGEMFIPIILIVVWTITGSMGEINSMLEGFSTSSYFMAIVFTIIHFFAIVDLVSSTSVSREGKSFRLNKLLPIDIKMAVKAKVIFHLILMTLIQIIFLVLFILFFSIEVGNLIWMIPLFIINSVNISLGGLLIDYSNPKLDWDVAVAAVKRNINGILGMLLGIIVVAPSLLIIYFKFNLIILSFISSIIILFVLKKLVENMALKLVSQD